MSSRIAPVCTAIAAWAVLYFAPQGTLAQHAGHGGGGKGGAFSMGLGLGTRGGLAGRAGAHDGFEHHGGFRLFARHRAHLPRACFFGPFGFAFLPGYGYSTFAYPYYGAFPQFLIDPETVLSDQVPWDVDQFAGSENAAESYWLIALTDDTVILATDYWLEGTTMHCITRDGRRLSMSVSQVDATLTKALNRGRGRNFQLRREKSGDPQPDGEPLDELRDKMESRRSTPTILPQ